MKVGSMASGYGGLDMAVERWFAAETVWHCEYDTHASRVLAERWPGVPNLGDITAVDWTRVEPVDVVTAGYPCQPFSHAGKRKGIADERHIWPWIADAVRILRPRYVVLENVAGHVGLGFDTVLADLAGLGFDAEWGVVRASDAGACHGRARLFVVARTAGDSDRTVVGEGPVGRAGVRPVERESADAARTGDAPADASGDGRAERRPGAAERPGGGGQPARAGDAPADADGEQQHRPRQSGTRRRQQPPNNDFGPYTAAVQRWADTIGRPPPPPTVPNRDGRPRLNPQFVEWMMGLPAGWVTGVDGVARTQQLKILGNGVVPQQALLALHLLHGGDMPVHHGLELLSTPTAGLGTGGGRRSHTFDPRSNSQRAPNPRELIELLPTPVVNDMGAGKTPEQWDDWTDRMRSTHGNGNGHGKSLSIELTRLEQT